MRLTKLTLTNFRSFNKPQEIEFAPLTLLFGPNSVGKSTVIMALFYLQQIIDKGQANPTRIEALKSKQLGGFLSLVHGKDLSKDITIKIELDKLGTIGKSYLTESTELAEAIKDDDDISLNDQVFLMPSVVENSNKLELEFTISWSVKLNSAKVKFFRVWSDDVFLAELSSDLNQDSASISRLNFKHPVLRPENQTEWLNFVESSDYPVSADSLEPEFDEQNFVVEKQGCNSLFQFFLEEKSETVFRPKSFDELDDEQQDEFHPLDEFSIMPVSVNCRKVGLPKLNEIMDIAGIYKPDIGLNAEYLNYAQMQSVFSEIFVSPLDNLLGILQSSANIGPLRTVPDPNFITKSETEQKDWYDGRAAWDLLAADRSELSTNVSDWLSRLGTDCRVCHADDITSASLSTKDPFLYDENSNLAVWPSELGVGISQVIPLVVAANTVKKGIVAIEQPELHIHPRIQTELGDLLTQVNSKANFLIETHSEHLILRLRKRIRQTTDNELPEGFKPVKYDDISIVYFEPSSEGVIARRIKLDEDGEFTSKWPQGFFSERREEYM
jgi:predicted ATPase